MIFTKIYIDNLYSFHECEIDLSISGRSKSTIPYEYLKGCEKFRFRKVCIISGANASGKTALGRVLSVVQTLYSFSDIGDRFLALSMLARSIAYKEKKATVQVEFISWSEEKNKYIFNDYTITIHNNDFSEKPFSEKSYSFELDCDDTIVSVRDKMKEYKQDLSQNEENIQKIIMNGMYILSGSINSPKVVTSLISNNMVLEKILSDMDSSIKNVILLENKDRNEIEKRNALQVIFNNGDEITINKDGVISNPGRFSAGTLDSFDVAILLSKIIKDKQIDKNNNSKTTHNYFLDEKMSKVHSELEISILNLMIDKLPHNAQLFYTTHNYDVVSDMNLPLYSYLFMGKEQGKTVIVQPEENEIITKNKEKLLDFLKNDFFCILPSTKGIDELLFDEDNNDLFGE